ncbi:GPI mannosyltransferase 1 [Pluteus cervinus]|uniref:GPI mannosyltransferase 1 n=1 Tax=Pluteus cervinus TaxID=181527 RepID=A0ACD3B3M3_9AGAR|nr:GPI mannosyltransferase 1 [Pluteus cervinus]
MPRSISSAPSSSSATYLQYLPSFRNVLIISTVLRIVLIKYSEWHDAHSVVKYTDIDYRVFTDAAQFIWSPSVKEYNIPKGWVGQGVPLGDPYMRETYRYTPLLALLLTPNCWLHPSFGKYLFAGCDILNGLLIYKILVSTVLPFHHRKSDNKSGEKPKEAKTEDETSDAMEKEATLYAAIHLLNPLVFSISTRGSSESVLSTLVLLTLYAALNSSWDVAAVMLGLSTHWKIYPLIYGVACLGVVGSGGLVNGRTVRFTFVSAGTFVLLGVGNYAIWGYPFLYESYLYHLHRLDHRHNFSPYFYLTYLTYTMASTTAHQAVAGWSKLLRSPLTSFVPQMILSLGTGLLFGKRKEDLIFAWFVQTVVFVQFNKVCTSQYFLWYLLLLPLLLPSLSMTRRKALVYAAVWVGTQALWLSEAYRLEFLGQNVFFGLWARGLIYVVGNCWVLAGVMKSYAPSKTA